MDERVLYLILGFIVLLIITSFTYAYWSHQYWITYGFEQIQPHLFYGNLKPYLRHNLEFGTALRNYYNESTGLKYVGMYMIYKPALLLRDPQTIQQFWQTNFVNFSTRDFYSAKEKCPLLDTMYQRSGPEWKKERELIAKAFSPANIADLYEAITVTRALERYLDGLTDCAVNAISINKLAERHLYNVMAWLIYGVHVDTISYAEESFRMTGIEVFRPKVFEKILFLRNFAVPIKWQWLLNLLSFRRQSKKVEDFYVSLTKHSLGRREFHPKEWNMNKDFMQYLMKIRNRGYLFDDEKRENIRVDVGAKKHLSLEEVSSQAFLAFSSGFPTILTTFDFFMFEVAKDPTIQHKLSVEIEDMFERTEGNPEYPDIGQMTYLEACLNETFRKYPPIPYLVRYCTKDFRMKRENFMIEKGMPIFVSVLGIHHDPTYYPDPLKFDPDRFTAEAFMQRPPLTFLPFGFGPKYCIGMELAKAVLKTHLVFMFSKYVVSIAPKMKNREINFDTNYLNEVHRINLCFGQRMKLSPSEEDE